MTGASFHRHSSNQCVATPREFIVAFEKRWGPIGVDLAAIAENAVCPTFISPEQDTWKTDWTQFANPNKWAWMNPEHESSGDAARKMYLTRVASGEFLGALLVPAAIGANWWRHHVNGCCLVVVPHPRISFDDANPYPKDLALCLYGAHDAGIRYWDWHEDVPAELLEAMRVRQRENRKRLFAERHPGKVAEKLELAASKLAARELAKREKYAAKTAAIMARKTERAAARIKKAEDKRAAKEAAKLAAKERQQELPCNS